MSEFLDNQAEESENSGNNTPEDSTDEDLGPKTKRPKRIKKTKPKKKKRINRW